jgi:hypothetical protein
LRITPEDAKTGGAAKTLAEETSALLQSASGGSGMRASELFDKLETLFPSRPERVWKALRKQGLALYRKNADPGT